MISGIRTSPSITCATCGSGASRSSRSIPSRRTAPSCDSRLPRPLPPGDSISGRPALGRPALHGAPTPGPAGPALRLRAVVSQGGRLRPLRLGGAPAVSRRRVLWRVRARFTVDLDVPEDQVIGATGVPVCGDPGWERANRAPPSDRLPARLLWRETPSTDACDGRRSGTEADPLVCRERAPLRHVAQPRRTATRAAATATSRSMCSISRETRAPGAEASRWSGPRPRCVARPAVRAVRLAADHQRPPDRGRRHRVPDDDA